ncbi:hypothetical protein RYX36_030162 [Vicia faba]
MLVEDLKQIEEGRVLLPKYINALTIRGGRIKSYTFTYEQQSLKFLSIL